MLGVEHAIAVSSGTDALLLALMALGVGPGDEVITSTYSFFATAGAIVRARRAARVRRHRPGRRSTSTRRRIAAAITPRTKAIMPVHLFGSERRPRSDPATMASRSGLPVVEDAAQAIGATYKVAPVGGLGTFGCFSFFPSKNLGAFGDAGPARRRTTPAWRRARACCATHGMEPKYLPSRDRRQLPDGRDAGGGAARQGAASSRRGPRRGG